ncbi:uncharacterized protein [Clytia hemisphaerica]
MFSLIFCMAALVHLGTLIDAIDTKVSGYKIQELVQCPLQVEALGCWKDERKNRAFPDQIMNSRDPTSNAAFNPIINWGKYNAFLSNFICECGKKILKKKNANSAVIGIQYYAECWGDYLKENPDFKMHDETQSCVSGSYSPYLKKQNNQCQVHTGQSGTMFVYKIQKHYRTCPEMQGKYDIGGSEMTITNQDGLTFQGQAGKQIIMDGEFYRGCSGSVKYNGQSMSFHYAPETCILTYGGNSATKKNCDKSMMCPFYKNLGCWNDFDSRKNPRMTKYIFNDRDRTDIGWSGTEISWDNWQYGYLQELLCRCAKAAKENGMKYFSIQYYAECWITNDEPKAKADGEAHTCVNDEYKFCNLSKSSCKAQICAGVNQSNQLYEIKQGPMMCDSNPCPSDKQCVTDGPDKYYCQ